MSSFGGPGESRREEQRNNTKNCFKKKANEVIIFRGNHRRGPKSAARENF